jgi:hypothetical protein
LTLRQISHLGAWRYLSGWRLRWKSSR